MTKRSVRKESRPHPLQLRAIKRTPISRTKANMIHRSRERRSLAPCSVKSEKAGRNTTARLTRVREVENRLKRGLDRSREKALGLSLIRARVISFLPLFSIGVLFPCSPGGFSGSGDSMEKISEIFAGAQNRRPVFSF